MGWEKLAIFDQNCRFSLKPHDIGPWLLWITSVSVPVTLSGLNWKAGRN